MLQLKNALHEVDSFPFWFLSPLLPFTQHTLAIRKLLVERDNHKLFQHPIIIGSTTEDNPRAFRHIINDIFLLRKLRIITSLHQRPAESVVNKFSTCSMRYPKSIPCTPLVCCLQQKLFRGA